MGHPGILYKTYDFDLVCIVKRIISGILALTKIPRSTISPEDNTLFKYGSQDVLLMPEIVFSNIRDRAEICEIVAQWLWSFWGNPRNYEFYHSLVAHSKTDEIPMIYVAFMDGKPVGAVGLLRADLFSRQDLYPWMADLYVHPEYRSRGIGSALQDFILAKAKELGYPSVYLYTPLIGYYEKKGWEFLGDEMDRDGEIVRIYKINI